MPRGFEGERESQRANDPSGRSGQGGGGGRERAMEAASQAARQQAAQQVAQRAADQQVAQEIAYRNQLAQQTAQAAIDNPQIERAIRAGNIMRMSEFAPLGFGNKMISQALGTYVDPVQRSLQGLESLRAMQGAGMVDGYLQSPAGRGYLSQGSLGQVTYTGMPDPNYTGAYANLINPPVQEGGGRPQQVPPVQDPVTGQARCPAGYVFNETLQACVMDTAATSSFQPTAPTAQPMPSGGYYARTGLLDQPPAGLLEAGFGSPQDFAAANTAFRMGAATRPSMYTDPYNLQGYTLLS